MSREFESPIPGTQLDTLRTISLIAEEGIRIQEIFHRAFVAPAQTEEPAAPATDESSPEPTERETLTDEEEEVLKLVRDARRLLFTHPIAAQKAFSALIAEGRKFATTEAGQEWVAALGSSDLLRKGRRMWSAMTLDTLEEQAPGALPSAYLELLLSFTQTSERSLDLWAEELSSDASGEPK